MGTQARVGIVGASGYGGIQLVRLLTEHPNVELVFLGGEGSAGKAMSDIYPHLHHRGVGEIELVNVDEIAQRADIVFLALPNGCLLYTSPSPRDLSTSRMPSSA